MFGSSRCQILNIINLWRAVSVIYLLYNSSINIGVTANKNMFINNVQTLSFTQDRNAELTAEMSEHSAAHNMKTC